MFNGNMDEVTDGITSGVELRKQRGLEIAAVIRIDRKGKDYIVPSMSGNGRYTVNPKGRTCTCPDFASGCKCKHQFAVEFAMKRETIINADGSETVTETVELKATKKTTYTQDWPAYNAAQTNEQDQFRRLLSELCQSADAAPFRKGWPSADPDVGRSVFGRVQNLLYIQRTPIYLRSTRGARRWMYFDIARYAGRGQRSGGEGRTSITPAQYSWRPWHPAHSRRTRRGGMTNLRSSGNKLHAFNLIHGEPGVSQCTSAQ